jgi:large subunit ribosomal protein L6
VPKGVEIKVDGQKVSVKGPKGQLARSLHAAVKANYADGVLNVEIKDPAKQREHARFHGLSRSLLNNMVVGVSSGFEKSLKLVGVGYRAAVQGKELQLALGYSHPINYPIEQGLDIKVDKQTTVIVSGIDKEQVGQAAANIRSFRPPEPYHGKGVRYADETIVTKVGKSSGKKK